MTSHRQFWYIVCESRDLGSKKPVAAQILDQWVVCFRNSEGLPVAFPDKCLHRCGRLSRGKVNSGELTCGYHGWTYDASGRVVSIPSEGGRDVVSEKNLETEVFETREQDGYVYLRLESPPEKNEPFAMPYYKKAGWQNLRMVHDFKNTVTNCVENFIDVPHTAYVHRGIFRKEMGESIEAKLVRKTEKFM